jgi:hypothetical protein
MKVFRIGLGNTEFKFSPPRPEVHQYDDEHFSLQMFGTLGGQVADYAMENDFTINDKKFRAMQCCVGGSKYTMLLQLLRTPKTTKKARQRGSRRAPS